MAEFFNVEWLDSNGQRAYPLADDATRTDVSGTFTIPDSFLVALYFPVPFSTGLNPDGFFIRVISAFATGYIVGVAYNDGSSDPPVIASAIVPKGGHTINKGYALGGSGIFDGSNGKIAIGITADIDRQPSGRWIFNYADGKLDPDTIWPMVRGVTAIYVINGRERSIPIFGEVNLYAGTNMKLSVDPEHGITFDAIEGAGLNQQCDCVAAPAQPITSINGIVPDEHGNIALTGNSAMDILAGKNSINLVDKASLPCCGCKELEALVAELTYMSNQATALLDATNNLLAFQRQLNDVILGSKIGNGNCLDCE